MRTAGRVEIQAVQSRRFEGSTFGSRQGSSTVVAMSYSENCERFENQVSHHGKSNACRCAAVLRLKT